MVLTEEQQEQFEEAAVPLITFLAKHCDAHSIALVTSCDAELKAGVYGTGFVEVIGD